MPRIATERIGRVNGRIRSSVTPYSPNGEALTVAVAAISHNYGRYLGDALSSVLRQSYSPAELIVVDDSSIDNTANVARSFGVPYYRIDKRHQYYGMQKAMQVTSSDILCFLDADDMLPEDYLSQGIKRFSAYDTGIVYSDMQKFGSESGVRVFDEFNNDNLQRENFIHAGSLVRREALVSSRALDIGMPEDMSGATDWYVWKQVCREGWKALKQNSQYRYRIHDKSISSKLNISDFDYFVRACLASEPVSFFIALSGRQRYWKRMARFLNTQQWPKGQVQLILMDTSGSKRFHKKVSSWAFRSDYDDVRVMRCDSGEPPGKADEDRRDDSIRRSVQRSVARIYNRMAREVTTEYVLTIEDDVLPPVGVVEMLLRAFGPSTASVAAPLKSRYHNGYLHWYLPKRICTEEGAGVEDVAGNGFGCTVLRKSVLKDTVFTSNPQFCSGDFDGSFYERIPEWEKKVHWDCKCIHGE
jgi:glycosyltransferase involved in cell wall biosynthesis